MLESTRSAFRRLGQFAPQLIAFLSGLSLPSAAMPSLGRGEEEIKSWASKGFVRPDGLAFTPGTEKRSQSSRAGSARGVLRTWASFFTSTAGVASLEAGDDSGEELRARFRPLRGSKGDMARGWRGSRPLRQRMRSPGDRFSSSVGASGLVRRSCHAVRAAGVAAGFDLPGAGGEACRDAVPWASGSGWGSNSKDFSLDFVFAETGKGRGGAAVVAVGLLLDLCHCGRWW